MTHRGSILRCELTALTLLAGVSSAAAQTAPGAAAGASVSPRLQVQPQVNALPEALHNPTRREAPEQIHQGHWGAFNRDGGVPAGFGPVARYGTDRAAEDWSALRDRRERTDWLDPLKLIPLGGNETVTLTLSGDQRLKNWFESAPSLGQQKPDNSGRMTVRGLYGADLHLGPQIRLYGEVVNGDAGGWGGYGYNATYRKTLDVQQLFVEARASVAGAQAGVRVGRQAFLDAPNYVLYQRATPDVPLSWNGVRLYAVWPRARIDLFDLVQTNTSPSAPFADTENYGARLSGAYGSWAAPDFSLFGRPGHVFVDLFYLGYDLGGAPAAMATATANGMRTGSALATTHRDNDGVRLWGKAGPIVFSLGGIVQGGTVREAGSAGDRAVHAYALNGVAGWQFAAVVWAPLLGVQADWNSGGNDRTRRGTVGTYLAPFSPDTNYLDTTATFAPANLFDLAPTLELTPSAATALRFKLPVFWRASTSDAVYGIGRIYSFGEADRGAYVATVPQLSFAWRLTVHLSWTQDLARVLASAGLRRAGGMDDTYYLSTFDYRF